MKGSYIFLRFGAVGVIAGILGLFAGALICLFLHNTTALVKATIVLCSGGYAGLIFGFLGGIFYIYKDAASLPHTATGLYNHQNTHLA